MCSGMLASRLCRVVLRGLEPRFLPGLLVSERFLTRTTSSQLSPARDQTGAGTGQNKQPGLIWEGYKRNFKGAIPPKRTRLRCKRGTKLCGNPCPICRNEIEISYTDHELLEQFLCPHTGQILEASKTGLCRQQQKRLTAAVEKAWENGVLPYPIPRELPEETYRIPPWNQIYTR
ncbi:28S ribosomal protein S18b, mitochondrial [Geodia barretti]|uniref:Small ribosomal subunit protein mS40 n=1 Tax=Geodia barretti TaxID=519541 RepID=A0AA35X5D2_GEOBA|nr:28S ribosomal protein S18b, mitochondrial [Geodia barretti]